MKSIFDDFLKVILIAKIEIVNTSFNCQNKILYIRNLMHIYKYKLSQKLALFVFWDSCLKNGKMSEKILGARGKSIFFHYFGEGTWNFYDTKIQTWKINYNEKKVKLNNEDKSKNNDNEIKDII